MSAPATSSELRIGIDLGGTKIEGLLMDRDGRERLRRRIVAPRDSYDATIRAIADLVAELEGECGAAANVGVGMPGSLSRRTGLVQNSNSTWLNGHSLDRDLSAALARPLRFANDANCFALSEAVDGAGAGAACVFGVILGTGCGGGVVVGGRLVDGPLGIGGEWGHNPLPWAQADEHPGPRCWCGRYGCMEMWVSGTGLQDDYRRATGEPASAQTIVEKAAAGDAAAAASLERHASRLARGLAHVANILDPEVIVLGGGLSQLPHLYEIVPRLASPHIFADRPSLDIRAPRWGDASGARGAAWLWNDAIR